MGNAIVVRGVGVADKSNAGLALAMSLAIPIVDAGDLRAPRSNARMAASQPLTDDGPWPWSSRGASHFADIVTYPGGGVAACCALKCAYRDRIRTGVGGAAMFVLLDMPPETAHAHLCGSKYHFMPASLIESQFATLQMPSPDETDVITLAVTHGVEEIVSQAPTALGARGLDNSVGQEACW
jgi:gluconokinase